jgi:hypothetical protein
VGFQAAMAPSSQRVGGVTHLEYFGLCAYGDPKPITKGRVVLELETLQAAAVSLTSSSSLSSLLLL